MKIIHVSDTHLGYSAYRKSTKDGINQREIDVYNAFTKFIDYIIENKPDLVIHAGDLFDSVRPNNRAITVAVQQLVRISNEHIPFILLAGNHEHPKLKETGHIFSVFDHIKNIYPVYNSKYEKIKLKIKDEEILIHAIPQCNNKAEYDEELKKLKPDKKTDLNVFVSHGSVTGVKEFTMNEFNELIIPARVLSRNFNYIALGHFHKYTKLADNAFYSGALESLSFADANEKKGFLELNLTKDKLTSKFVEVKIRQMVDVKPIKCSNLKLDQIMKKIKEKVQEIKPKEKTIRITLDDIPSDVYRGLDFNEIRKITSDAVHYELKANIKRTDDVKKQSSSSKIDALVSEFKSFLEAQKIEDQETVLDLGIGYIEKIEAREEGK